jgi:hypothetical protein
MDNLPVCLISPEALVKAQASFLLLNKRVCCNETLARERICYLLVKRVDCLQISKLRATMDEFAKFMECVISR